MAQKAPEKKDTESDSSFDYHIDQFLEMMVENRASDLIIKVGSPPSFRIDGNIQKADMDPLTPEQTEKLARDFIPEDEMEALLNRQEYDGSYGIPDVGRFRVNAFLQRESVGIVFRHIEDEIFSFDELNLPESVEKLPYIERGMVLVTGTTSSGKSTTLASVIDYINEHMSKHVVTIEDPIEYVHDDKKSVITQREVGLDTDSFADGVKFVLRQDPDIILLGEMRDQVTVEAAIEAAQTGHLVFSTLHTNTTAQTIDRLVEFFPNEEQERIRLVLSEYLMAVLGQRLLSRCDKDGMVPAVEVMFNTPIVQKLIAEDRVSKLHSAIHQGTNDGMQTFDQSLLALHEAGMIDDDEARKNCSKPDNWPMYKKGHFPDIDTGVLGGMGG
ncbi:MAG: type IV pilus twitching motility protein PilT [bacterium]